MLRRVDADMTAGTVARRDAPRSRSHTMPPNRTLALWALATLIPFGPFGMFSGDEARAADPDAGKITLATRTTRLANGLQVVLHEDHRTPIVAVTSGTTWARRTRREARHGFAHLFEHVMFQGSKHVPEDTYFRYLERAGASNVNGSTSEDRTNYFETVPQQPARAGALARERPHGVPARSRRPADVRRPARRREERAAPELRERAVRARGRSSSTRPSSRPSHPYHHLAIGSPEDLDAATLDDVKRVLPHVVRAEQRHARHRRRHRSRRDAEARRAVLRPHPARRRSPERPGARRRWSSRGETRLEVEAGVELPRVVSGVADARLLRAGRRRARPAGEGAHRAARRAASTSASSTTSRLRRTSRPTRRPRQLAVEVRDRRPRRSPGTRRRSCCTAIDQELGEARERGVIDDAELARARTSFLARRGVRSRERGARGRTRSTTFAHYTGDPGYLPKDVARYEQATTQSLADAARTWLPPDSASSPSCDRSRARRSRVASPRRTP